MTFLNPWMLLGGAAVGIPLALHFFYRARYRPLPWAAMKFLRLSIEQTSRRLRFQELVLLILRVVVCLILALALARPASVSLTSGSGRGESVDAIIIIDTSYSMAAKEGEKIRLDRAKEAAIKIIDNLPPNSSAQIIACSIKATGLTLRTPTNLDQARHLIRNLKLSSQSTDFFAGFDAAFAAFKKTTGANKEVYLLSDMQRSGWDKQASAIRSKCEEIKDQASIYLVRCGEKTIKNVTIVGITPQTDIPHTGARIAFTVLLKNSGTEPVSNLQLTFEIDGKAWERDSRSVDGIAPGDTRAVTITGKIDQAGLRLLTARIKDDDLDVDNEFNRIMLVRERTRVLVVDGRPDTTSPDNAAAFYIDNALIPVSEEKQADYHVQVRTITPEESSAGSLGDTDVCILVNVAARRLQEDFVRALPGFVRSGKGLFITSGDQVVPKDYNSLFKELLPATLVDSEPYQPPFNNRTIPDLTTVDMLSFLSRLNDSRTNPLRTMNAAFTLAATLVAEPSGSDERKDFGQVLIRYNDGRPYLLSKSFGDGEVLFLTTSVDQSWSYLCIVPAFAPFSNGCLAHLVEKAGISFNRIAGEPLRGKAPDQTKEYVVVQPDGERIPIGKSKDEKSIDTPIAGVYHIVAGNEQQGERFAVVPDLRESESLEAISDEQIDEQLGFKPIHLSTGFDGSSFTGTERSRNERTIWVLIALLVFAFGETVWAWFCGRAW